MTTAAVYGQAIYGQTVYGNTTTPALTGWQFTRDPTSPTRMTRASIQRITVMVRALTAGTPADPTGSPVHFAFTRAGTAPRPTTSTAPTGAIYGQSVYGQAAYGTGTTAWVPGTWEPLTGPPVQYAARCLIGPGQTADLARGDWIVWVRVTGSPDVPIRAVGTLTIT